MGFQHQCSFHILAVAPTLLLCTVVIYQQKPKINVFEGGMVQKEICESIFYDGTREAPDHQVGKRLVGLVGAQLVGTLVGAPHWMGTMVGAPHWLGTLVGAPHWLGTRAGALWGLARLQLPAQRGPAFVNLISTFLCIKLLKIVGMVTR